MFSLFTLYVITTHVTSIPTTRAALQSHTRHLLQSEIVISGSYIDVATCAPPTPGWIVEPHQCIITWWGANPVIGPFSGTGSTGTETTNITQQFKCDVPAKVSVEFILLWCGETEESDYHRLYLNNVLVPSGSRSLTGGTIYSYAPHLVQLVNISGCVEWKYSNIWCASVTGDFDNPFTVKFSLGLSAGGEWGGVSPYRVICTKIPTMDPTGVSISPTTDTNVPTTGPTMNPTMDPTIDPSSVPTVDPTIDPSSDPTSDPTIDPSSNPTEDPTIDPSSNPTEDPTMAPTMSPTSAPSEDPTIAPTPVIEDEWILREGGKYNCNDGYEETLHPMYCQPCNDGYVGTSGQCNVKCGWGYEPNDKRDECEIAMLLELTIVVCTVVPVIITCLGCIYSKRKRGKATRQIQDNLELSQQTK